MPPTSSRLLSNHSKTVLNRRHLHNKSGLKLSDPCNQAAFRTAKSRALKKLRMNKGWNKMSPEEQRFAEGVVIRELEEARNAKKRAHELEWWGKLADEANANGGERAGEATLVNDQEYGDTHDSRFEKRDNGGEIEAWNDSDEWVSDVESDKEAVELIRKVQEKWTAEINMKLRMIEEAEVNEKNEWIATFM